MKKRNSLIELYRFLFAMNVVKNHGFFPYQGSYFSPGRISVEFFFVLSGYLLIRSIDKFTSEPYGRGLYRFTLAKLKPLAIPLIIALPFNILYKILTEDNSLSVWGYLWYVHDMIIAFMVYFTIRYFVKNQRTFLLITGGICLVCSVLHVIPFFYTWGYIRAGMSISLGILVYHLPKIKFRKAWQVWLLLAPVQAVILAIFLFGNNLLIEEILDLILYPTLVYLSFEVDCDNRVFNYLGSLSFGLYAFQCVGRPLRELGLTNLWVLFALVVILAVAEDGARRIYKHRKKAKLSGDTTDSAPQKEINVT